MFIFRVEHKREFCGNDSRYRVDGTSITGHGTFRKCEDFGWGMGVTPNFGLYGSPPYTAMMVHERCAVTPEQWRDWIAPDYSCKNDQWTPGDVCYYRCKCPGRFDLQMDEQWHIVSYWVEDHMEGTDWREDNNQIVFNPAFALNMGPVEEWEVFELTRQHVSA